MVAHEDIAALLPFYVNGTVSPQQRLQIETALAASPALRNELAQVQVLKARIQAGGESLMSGRDKTEDRLEDVLDRLPDPTPEPAAAAAPSPKPSLADLLGWLNPRRWHPVIPLGLAVAVALQVAGIIASDNKPLEDGFKTVSGQDVSPAAKGRLIIRVKEDAVWGDVEALLDAEGLTIISGPTEGRLMLATEAEGAALDALIAKLKAAPAIAFAGKGA